jgi:hypothetical protein
MLAQKKLQAATFGKFIKNMEKKQWQKAPRYYVNHPVCR